MSLFYSTAEEGHSVSRKLLLRFLTINSLWARRCEQAVSVSTALSPISYLLPYAFPDFPYYVTLIMHYHFPSYSTFNFFFFLLSFSASLTPSPFSPSTFYVVLSWIPPLLNLLNLMLVNSSIPYLVFFLLLVFNLPQSRLTPPGTYNPNARGSDACRGSN